MTDYYALLQVARHADPLVIRQAFRALMGPLGGHPDQGGDPARARQLIEAYGVLSDPATRRAYDRALMTPPPATWLPARRGPHGLPRVLRGA